MCYECLLKKITTLDRHRFLVGAFLKKRVDYSHGFSSVFFNDQNRPELTKIVLPNVLQNLQKTPKCTWWPKELNQNGFPRNIQYRRRPKGPPFQFFLALWDFFRKNFFRKSVPNAPILGNLKSFCYF